MIRNLLLVVVVCLLATSLSFGAISVTPSTLTYSGTVGGSTPASQTVAVSGTAGTYYTASSASWLYATSSGSVGTNITVSVVTSGLTAGTYTGRVVVASAGSTNQTVTVTLTMATNSSTTALTTVTFQEEFCTDPGELKWTTTAVGTAATIAWSDPAASHPCIIRMTSGTSNNGGGTMLWGSYADFRGLSFAQLATQEWQADVVFRFPTAAPSDHVFYLLFEHDTDFIGLRFDTSSDTNFTYLSAFSLSLTTADSGVTPASNTWYHFRMYRQSGDTANAVRMCMGACTTSTQITTNVPTSGAADFGILFNNSGTGTTSRSVDIDAWGLVLRGMTRW